MSKSPKGAPFTVLLNVALNGTASHVERAVKVWRREKRLQALEQGLVVDAAVAKSEQERRAMWRMSSVEVVIFVAVGVLNQSCPLSPQ